MVVFYIRFEVYFDIGTSGNMTQQMSFNSNRLFFVSARFFVKWVKLSPSGIHAMSLLLVPFTMPMVRLHCITTAGKHTCITVRPYSNLRYMFACRL